MKTMLINIDDNPKTVRGQVKGYMTGIMYLASGISSGYEVCPAKTDGCESACLYYAGRGKFTNIQNVRIKKTQMFFEKRDTFMRILENDIYILRNEAEMVGMTPCVRLNGTSDISWEDMGIIENFPDIQFYDYTKVYSRMFKDLPSNYYLTFSKTHENDDKCAEVLDNGRNVAVVFENDDFPSSFMGYPVAIGIEDDLRFLDPTPSVVALCAKGMAKKDLSGFVVRDVTINNIVAA